MSLTWNKRTVTDQSVEFPNRFKVDGEQKVIEPDFGVVDDAGTPVNAEYLQPIEDFLEAVVNTHNEDVKDYVPHLGTTTNSGNAYSITSTKVIAANSKFSVKFNAAATGTATLNISSDGAARTLIKPGGGDFKPKAGVYTFIRDGENFQCVGEGGEYGNATPDKVLTPYTIGTEDGVIPGTMPNNGPASAETINLTSQNQEYTIAQGWHSGIRKIKAAISGLVAGVIKAGTTVGGVLGTFTSDATATKSNILANKTAYVNGAKITGDMPNNGSQTATLEITGAAKPTKTIPAGYTSGGTVTTQLASSLAQYILNTQMIGGVAGTLQPGKKWASGEVAASGSATSGSFYDRNGNKFSAATLSVSGLAFKPKSILVYDSELAIGIPSFAYYEIIQNGSYYVGLYGGTQGTVQKRGSFTITADGFTVPAAKAGRKFLWIAYGD